MEVLKDLFPLEMLPKCLESLLKQLEDGVITKMLDSLPILADKEELMLFLEKIEQMSIEKLLSRKKKLFLRKIFVIVEFLLQNKKTILKDKFLTWLTNIPDAQLLETLDPELTSRGKDFYPFWNNRRKDLYELLPCPQRIDYVDSGLNSSNGSSNRTVLKSWFSIKKIPPLNKNLQEISLPSCKFLTVDGMENEDITLSEITRCKKIKLRVPTAAKAIFNKWKDIYRFCYNKAVWLNQETGISGRILRDCVKSDNQQVLYPFVLDLPTELREGAAIEFSKNLKSAFSNKKAENITHFKMGFKRRKEKSWCLTNFYKRSLKHVLRHEYSEKGIYVSVNNKRKFKILPTYCPYEIESYEDIPDEITNDFSIYFDGHDYYLVLPQNSELIDHHKTGIVTALDPGVRTFQTTFNNNGESFEIATSESSARLHSLAKILDGMISKRSRCPRRERIKWSRRIFKLRKKLKNLQTELHYKTANFLTRESDIIIIPEFKVKEMSRKFKRKIRTKTVRNMMLLGHSLFKQKLKNKAIERGCQILICGEQYTSKTCTKCGTLNNKIGGSKTFTCLQSSCAQIIDRDVNAARNILLRAMRGSAIFFKDILETLLFKNSHLKRWKQLFSCVKLSHNV